MDQRKIATIQLSPSPQHLLPTTKPEEKSGKKQYGHSLLPKSEMVLNKLEMIILTLSGNQMAHNHISSTYSSWKKHAFKNYVCILISNLMSHTPHLKYLSEQETTCKISNRCNISSSSNLQDGILFPLKQNCWTAIRKIILQLSIFKSLFCRTNTQEKILTWDKSRSLVRVRRLIKV
jgi:hypothetical protein